MEREGGAAREAWVHDGDVTPRGEPCAKWFCAGRYWHAGVTGMDCAAERRPCGVSGCCQQVPVRGACEWAICLIQDGLTGWLGLVL